MPNTMIPADSVLAIPAKSQGAPHSLLDDGSTNRKQSGFPKKIPGIKGSETVLKHSQDMYDSQKARANKDGTSSTFVGAVVNWDWLNDGKATLVPSFINGKQYDYSKEADRREAAPYLKGKEWPHSKQPAFINGKFNKAAVYEVEQMEKAIHKVMAKQGGR